MSLTDVFHTPNRAQALSELSHEELILAAVITIESSRRPILQRDIVATSLAEIIIASNNAMTTSRIMDLATMNGLPWHVVQQYSVLRNGGYRPLSEAFEALADDVLFQKMVEVAGTWSITERPLQRERLEHDRIIESLAFITSPSIIEKALYIGPYAVTAAALLRLIDVAPLDHVAGIMDAGLLMTDSGFLAAALKMPTEHQLRWAFQGDRSFIHRDKLQATLPTEVLVKHLPLVEPHVRAGIEQVLAARAQQS
jgi:hypothetical protein